jgi:hypothetical protein
MYALVFLVLVGGLLLDIFPEYLFTAVDTIVGRSVGFLIVAIIGGILGVPEAILAGTILGLMIDRSHDGQVSSGSNATTAGSGQPKKHLPPGGVLRDMTPTYTGHVARRLGLVTLDNHRNIMEDSVSYRVR